MNTKLTAFLLILVAALSGCRTRFPATVEAFSAISVRHADSWTDGGTIDFALDARRGSTTREYLITLTTPLEGNATHQGRLTNRIYLNHELVERDSTEEQDVIQIMQQLFFWSEWAIEIDSTAKDSPNLWERPPHKSTVRSLAYRFLKNYGPHSREQRRSPPPYAFTYSDDRPANGFYIPAASKTEPWIECEDIYSLSTSERREVSILESSLTSYSNANTNFALSVTAPYLEGDYDSACVILVVDGTAYRRQGSGSRISAQSVSYLSFSIGGIQKARQVSKYLGIPMLSRKNPQHGLAMTLTPLKQNFLVGEDVEVSFLLSNDGTNTVSFLKWGTNDDGVDYQYRFSAHHRGERVKCIMESSDPGPFVDPERYVFEPGDVIEGTVTLSKWFTFDLPGGYDIKGMYQIDFVDPDTESLRIIWEDDVEVGCRVRISRRNTAPE